MDIQKWLNDQNIEAVQDRRDGKDYWMYDNLYTEIDLIELLEAFSLHVVGSTFSFAKIDITENKQQEFIEKWLAEQRKINKR